MRATTLFTSTLEAMAITHLVAEILDCGKIAIIKAKQKQSHTYTIYHY
jgi:hypothetical protein